MSTSPSVSCPEPLPYSDDVSGYADIDFNVAAPKVYSMQPNMVQVDSILSNQLGPTSNPMQAPSSTPAPYVAGFPVLATVGENNAKPLLSSYMGADISSPTTLSSGNTNFLSVNDIVGSPSAPAAPTVAAAQQFTNVPVQQQSREHFSPKNANAIEIETPNNVREHFGPQPKPREKIGPQPQPKNNLATFINKNNNKPSIEHFKPKNIEHFKNLSTMDNIVLTIVIGTFIYYIVTLKHGHPNVDVSKIPILSQLSDNNVSNENKIIIVLAVVIACVLISRMLK